MQTIYEETNKVRIIGLQIFTNQFEELGTKESEIVELYKKKLTYVLNQAHQLGERDAQEKLVWKTLKSLPERFRVKVTAIKKQRMCQL